MALMVSGNAHFMLGSILPSENDPPLLVDSNAPESGQIPLQRFKPIARGNLEILNDSGLIDSGLIDHPELAPDPFLGVSRQTPDPQTPVNALGL